jgi:hypothetical protein
MTERVPLQAQPARDHRMSSPYPGRWVNLSTRHLLPPKQAQLMRNSGKAPTMIIWVIALILYLVALAAHFGLAKIGAPVATWSWIIGFGLLLLACRVRGL